MRRILLVVAALLLTGYSVTAATWQTDYQSALQTARSQNRPVLINFTGSDWCGWCIRLRKEVFDTAEFDQYAASRLVLLEVDFPNNKPQSVELQRANQALQKQFGVRGYPTLFVVDAQGKVLQQLGYMEGGPKVFLGELSKVVPAGGPETQNGWIVGQAQPQAAAAPEPPAKDTTSYVPSGTPAKVIYDKLLLKGITGSASSPLALINNKTFGAGDSYKVQVGAETLKVKCISIAADYAMVQVEGEAEPRKLTLGLK